MMTNFVVLLESYCKKKQFGDPFYSTPIPNPKNSIQDCHCTVLVDLYGYKQFLDEVGHGKSENLTRQDAAKIMLEKLNKFSEFSQENAIDNIKKISDSYYDDYDNSEYENKKSPKNLFDTSYKDIYGTKKHEADNQLERMQKLQGDDIDIISKSDTNWEVMEQLPCDIDLTFQSLNLQPKLSDSRETCNNQLNVESSKTNKPVVNEKLNDSSMIKDDAQLVKKIRYPDVNNFNKNSSNICLDQGERLSIYHDEMNSFFGHDKKRQIQQEISKLNVDLQLKDLATIGKLDNDYSYSSKAIEYYVNKLDEIMLQVNVGVETVVFIVHDGRFIRTIRVTTIPEIVEVEIGCKLDGLGLKALFDVIDKLRKLMS
ncbi:hypothetical protein HCN44_003403 [Aphidius gifuensis]|uniref:Uncharacterized protein n=1 Tax=Aphidius gifuensis TaxID=684658 RepID=A0A834XXX1_APHGI|nr:uncharacterized protein LOC122849294 [Aphidius gifuensis]KAF7994313.1 hypothetical protein HCN44_003403 [Aphidius gifuensis]